MLIREAVESDLIACHAVFIASVVAVGEEFYSREEKGDWVGRFPFEELVARFEKFRYWVAEEDGVVIGFIGIDPERRYVDTMFVHPDYQGRGVSKALFEALKGWAVSEGYEEIFLEASRNAKGIYEKWGFVESEFDGVREGCLGMRLGL